MPEVNVDEESVEPPVDHEQSDGDLVAAEELNEVLGARPEANVDHCGDRERCVKS